MRPKKSPRNLLLLSGSIALTLSSANAQSTWVPTGGGTYSWQLAANWSTNPTIPNAIGTTANLNINTAGIQTIQLNGAVTLGTLNIGDSTTGFFAQTIAAGTSGRLTFNNSGSGAQLNNALSTQTNTISAGVTVNDVLTITNTAVNGRNNPLQLSGQVTGSSRIIIAGGGNTYFSNATNNYNGGLQINAGGVFQTGSNSAAFGSGMITINGGTVDTSFNGAASQSITTTNASTWNGNWALPATVSAGTWTMNTGAVTLGNNITVTRGSNLIVNGLIDDGVSSFSLAFAGNGATNLNNANTYNGGTTLTAGTLRINNSGSGGTSSAIGTGTLTINGGTIDNNSGGLVTLSTNNVGTLGANMTFTGSNSLNLGTGNFSLGATRIITVSNNTLTIGGVIQATGAHGIRKQGAGTLVLTNNNLTTGNNTVESGGGVLNIRHGGALGPGALTRVNSGNALEFQNNISVTEALALNGTGVSNGGALRNISGNNTLVGLVTLEGATRVNSDAGTLTLNPTSGNGITGTHNLTFGGVGDITVADPIAISTGTLTKDGAGTLTLNAGVTNTYTGATNVNDGTLLVNGNISTSVLTTVASGATIGGSGTTGALTIQDAGTVAPGTSPGILNVNGNYIQAGEYEAESEGIIAGNSPGNHDQIIVAGTVNITGGSLTTLFSGTGYTANGLIFILLNDGTDAITGTYTGLAQGAVVDTYGGYDWIISYNAHSGANTFTGTQDGNDIALMATVPVPEPNVAALLGTLGTILLLRRRR